MLAEISITLFIISLGRAVGSMALDLTTDCFAYDDKKVKKVFTHKYKKNPTFDLIQKSDLRCI